MDAAFVEVAKLVVISIVGSCLYWAAARGSFARLTPLDQSRTRAANGFAVFAECVLWMRGSSEEHIWLFIVPMVIGGLRCARGMQKCWGLPGNLRHARRASVKLLIGIVGVWLLWDKGSVPAIYKNDWALWGCALFCIVMWWWIFTGAVRLLLALRVGISASEQHDGKTGDEGAGRQLF
jgi:hypothetical protein